MLVVDPTKRKPLEEILAKSFFKEGEDTEQALFSLALVERREYYSSCLAASYDVCYVLKCVRIAGQLYRSACIVLITKEVGERQGHTTSPTHARDRGDSVCHSANPARDPPGGSISDRYRTCATSTQAPHHPIFGAWYVTAYSAPFMAYFP